jgi:Putative glucoamylase
VTPHASALALAVDPPAATANLRALAARYPVYGDFGFYDAVDRKSGAVAPAYLTLDQAMIFLATANRLCDGCVQRRFAADPIAARAFPVMSGERFFE